MMMKKIVLFILTIMPFVQAIPSDLELPQQHKPIEWQIINLQEKIEKKVENSLNPLVDKSDYVIQVRVEIDENKKIDLSPKSGAGGGPGGGEDGEEDKNKKKKKEAEEAKKNQVGVRFTDSGDIASSPDYILFSKLGLEAPIYGVEEPSSNAAPKIELGSMGLAKPEKGNPQQQKSEIEMVQKSLVELNDKYNLFKYLLGVEVTIYLDDLIVEDSRRAIEKIIDNISFNLGAIEPNVRVEYVPLTAKKREIPTLDAKKDKKQSALSQAATKASEFLNQFGEIIGLVLAALILGIFALLTMKKYEDIQKNNNVNLKGKLDGGEDGAGAGAGAGAGGDGAGGSDGDGDGDGADGDGAVTGMDGIERFRKYLEVSRKEAILLVKKWIKESTMEANGALKALVKSLSNDELLLIFDSLKMQDRNTWKKVAAAGIGKDELQVATSYISQQIVEGIMVPNVIDDEQCIDLILDLSPREAAEFCQSNTEYGAILLNVLNSNLINSIFDNLSTDMIDVLIAKSSNFDLGDVGANISGLKSALKSYQKDSYRAPFMDRIVDLIRLSKGDNENALFGALAKAEDYDFVFDIAKNYFPSELVHNISSDAFKMGSVDMDLKDLAEFFVSQDDDARLHFMDLFAEEGSKAREMIELEVEQIYEDELQTMRIKKDEAEIWRKFITEFRRKVRTSPELYKAVKEELENWVQAFYGGGSFSSNENEFDYSA